TTSRSIPTGMTARPIENRARKPNNNAALAKSASNAIRLPPRHGTTCTPIAMPNAAPRSTKSKRSGSNTAVPAARSARNAGNARIATTAVAIATATIRGPRLRTGERPIPDAVRLPVGTVLLAHELLVGVVVPLEPEHAAVAFKNEEVGRYAVQEPPVMADDD